MIIKQQHLIAQRKGILGIRCGVNDGGIRFLQQTLQFQHQGLAQLVVKIDQRLVQQ